MACKLIDIMSATADELAEIEGIDSGMAFTIVEIRTQNHFIDLHTFSRITISKQNLFFKVLLFLIHPDGN
jgi:DNA uptake protein ComE-like DNA-binding protein